MKAISALFLLGAAGLGACSYIAKDMAREDLKAQCAKQGKQFVEQKSSQTELLVAGSASVSGICVGPGEPGYVPPEPAGAKKGQT